MHLHNSFFGTKLQVVKPYKIASLFLYTFSSTNLLFIWANNLYNNFIKQFYKIWAENFIKYILSESNGVIRHTIWKTPLLLNSQVYKNAYIIFQRNG